MEESVKPIINLWELITHARAGGSARVSEEHAEQVQQALGAAAHWNGQELSLQPVEEGWLIRIFSCFDDDLPGDGMAYSILIPKIGERFRITKTGFNPEEMAGFTFERTVDMSAEDAVVTPEQKPDYRVDDKEMKKMLAEWNDVGGKGLTAREMAALINAMQERM